MPYTPIGMTHRGTPTEGNEPITVFGFAVAYFVISWLFKERK